MGSPTKDAANCLIAKHIYSTEANTCYRELHDIFVISQGGGEGVMSRIMPSEGLWSRPRRKYASSHRELHKEFVFTPRGPKRP